MLFKLSKWYFWVCNKNGTFQIKNVRNCANKRPNILSEGLCWQAFSDYNVHNVSITDIFSISFFFGALLIFFSSVIGPRTYEVILLAGLPYVVCSLHHIVAGEFVLCFCVSLCECLRFSELVGLLRSFFHSLFFTLPSHSPVAVTQNPLNSILFQLFLGCFNREHGP